jgi:hypothetical protein
MSKKKTKKSKPRPKGPNAEAQEVLRFNHLVTSIGDTVFRVLKEAVGELPPEQRWIIAARIVNYVYSRFYLYGLARSHVSDLFETRKP